MTRRELEITDMDQMIKILDEGKYLHLGLVDDGMPYVIPMNYGYVMEDGKLTIYLHGATTGYKLDVMRKNPNACFTIETEVEAFEGRIACQYGTSYYSLIGRGQVTIVEDVEEKIKAMTILMKTQTGMDFSFNEKLVSIVSVMRVDVSEYTAKHRPAPPMRPAQGAQPGHPMQFTHPAQE